MDKRKNQPILIYEGKYTHGMPRWGSFKPYYSKHGLNGSNITNTTN